MIGWAGLSWSRPSAPGGRVSIVRMLCSLSNLKFRMSLKASTKRTSIAAAESGQGAFRRRQGPHCNATSVGGRTSHIARISQFGGPNPDRPLKSAHDGPGSWAGVPGALGREHGLRSLRAQSGMDLGDIPGIGCCDLQFVKSLGHVRSYRVRSRLRRRANGLFRNLHSADAGGLKMSKTRKKHDAKFKAKAQFAAPLPAIGMADRPRRPRFPSKRELPGECFIAGLFYHWYLPRCVTGVDRSSEAEEPGPAPAA